jgi:hypothetical protein
MFSGNAFSGWLAALVAVAALGGLLLPSTYARETSVWSTQAIVQDWINLVVVAPWLAITGALARRGSVKARLFLGGALVYTLYSFAIYAFAVHFNRLFLVYCAALGLSCVALVGLGAGFARAGTRGWIIAQAPLRTAGGFLVGIAVLFAALWLKEVLPAVLRGSTPGSIGEAGLLVNPVHVLDLSLLLPAMLIAGITLWRRQPLGLVLGPILLVFAALMTAAVGAMFVVLHQRGLPVDWPAAALFFGLTLASAALLAALLRHLKFPSAASEARGLSHRKLGAAVASSAATLASVKETCSLRARR